MKKSIALAIMLSTLVLSGCALMGEAVEKIADGVEKYCEQPLVYRQEFRNTVNAQLTDTGHTVHVHCAGDPSGVNVTSNTQEELPWLAGAMSERPELSDFFKVNASQNHHYLQEHKRSNAPLVLLPDASLNGVDSDADFEQVGQDSPHFNRMEASRKTQEEPSWHEEDMQLTLLSLLPQPQPLSQPQPGLSLSLVTEPRTLTYSAPLLSLILPQSRSNSRSYARSSASKNPPIV